MMELEICVESVASAHAAEAGGAQRIELCSALTDGGLTPSAALIRGARSQASLGIHVMIRPRAGDFLYSDQEYAVMCGDIEFAKEHGADGVVFGLVTASGEIDLVRTRALIQLARPMEITIHRAIDMTHDIEKSLEDLIQCGADRVLTSGGAQNAITGASSIERLVHLAANRIKVMVGGGVRPHNVQQLVQLTGATEFHAALRSITPSPVIYRNKRIHLGDRSRDDYERTTVRAEDVRLLREAMNQASLSTSIKTAATSA